MDSPSELELRDFLGVNLFLFVSDGETPTTNFAYGSPSHLESTEKDVLLKLTCNTVLFVYVKYMQLISCFYANAATTLYVRIYKDDVVST